jgi:esterase/lipase
MKRVLYLHGLESKQGGPKVDFLAKEFLVHAPEMNYKVEGLSYKLHEIIKTFKPDLIIGSSMGGYVADILSRSYCLPAILFNPALHSRDFEPDVSNYIPSEEYFPQKHKIVVLGEKDKVISPEKTRQLLRYKEHYTIISEEVGHRTPLSLFITIVNKYKNGQF